MEAGGSYFPTVATYIHLNPVRMKRYDFETEKLPEYRWSSYPAYVGKASGPEWLGTRRVLEGLGMADTPAGRRKYAEYMGQRVEEVRHSDKPWKADDSWQKIRRGWYLGSDGFRREMLDRLGAAMGTSKRESFSGEEVRTHDETRAEELIAAGMKGLRLTEADLDSMIKNSPEKYALAWLVRRNTCVGNAWIKARLRMGKATNFSELLKKIEAAKRGGWGFEAFHSVKHIKS